MQQLLYLTGLVGLMRGRVMYGWVSGSIELLYESSGVEYA